MKPVPFQFGQTIWSVSGGIHGSIVVPCSICFGKLMVKLTLGDGSECMVECSACDRGCRGPTGEETRWEPWAKVTEAVVIGLEYNKQKERWDVSCDPYVSSDAHLFETEDLAKAFLESFMVVLREQAVQWDENTRRQKRKGNWPWSVKYHRECIARAEQDIAWHRSKVKEGGPGRYTVSVKGVEQT